MRQALNNLQSTANGFGKITGENVFKVCDEPHPLLIKDMLQLCISGDVHKSCKVSIVVHTAFLILYTVCFIIFHYFIDHTKIVGSWLCC